VPVWPGADETAEMTGESRLVRPATRSKGVDLLMATSFAVITFVLLPGAVLLGNPVPFGWDAVLSVHAARDLIAGANPWASVVSGTTFTGLPTELVPFLPFVWLPDPLVAIAWVAIGLGSAIYAVRTLAMPMWWLAFPPLAIGIASGSSVPLVLALLVASGALEGVRGLVANAAAVIVRPYALLPTVLLGRWRAAFLAADLGLFTAPLIALPFFVASLTAIQHGLTNQTDGGFSATNAPGLFVLAAVGLVALGRQRAAWLIVPALWPDAKLSYGSIALPVLADMPVVAIALASPAFPGVIALGIAAQCAIEWFRVRTARRLPHRRWQRDMPVPV
jgi:hypothetical protein